MMIFINKRKIACCAGLIILALLCTNSTGTFAQSKPEYDDVKLKYKDEKAVVLEKKEKVEILIDDDTLIVTNNHYKEKLYLSDKGHYLSDEYIYYNYFSEVEKLKAYYYEYIDNKYKKSKVQNVVTQDDWGRSVFYNDSKVKHVVFPNVAENSKTIVSYTEIIYEPRFMGTFFFSSYMPTVNAEYSIKFPKGVKLKYKVFNDDDNIISFSEEKGKKFTTYTWKARNVEKYEFEDEALSISYYEPHVIAYIDEYEIKGKNHKLLSNISELYRWYYSLVKDINKESCEELEQLVDSLTSGVEDDVDKTKSIYYWVQNNIKYVAFEDGYAGFIPKLASEVYRNRYGDCKGMASIITSMLTIAGIENHLVWIGSRDIPYTYNELPTPRVDNHMIAAVKIDGEYCFLDATSSYLPLKLPSFFIQGKEALICKGKDDFEVQKVPVADKEESYVIDSMEVKIDGEDLKGEAKISLWGYDQSGLARAIKRGTEEKRKELFERGLEKGNNKFRIDTFSYTGLEDRDEVLVVNYEFTIPGYVRHIDDKTYLNLNLDTELKNEFIENREVDLVNDYNYVSKSILTVIVDEEFKLENVPDSFEYSCNDFGYKIKYTVEDNKIYVNKEIFVNTLLIETTQFDKWNEFIKSINTAYSKAIVLTKK